MLLNPGKAPKILASLAIISAMAMPANAKVSVSDWKKSTIKGAKAYDEQRFGDAERAFKAAIKTAKELGPDNLKLSMSLANLGVLYNYRGYFDKAEPLFEESVKLQEKVLGEENTKVVSSSGKLCQFYLKRKKFNKANPMAVRIIKYGEKRLAEVKLKSKVTNGKVKESSKTKITEAEKEENKKIHNEFLELAVLFDKVGANYEDYKLHGRSQMSEKFYELSLKLRKKVLSGKHLALSASYERLGKLYLQEGRYRKAEPLLNKAYYMSKSTLGFTKPRTYMKLDLWSKSLMGLGRYSKAESHYRYALKCFTEVYGTRSGYVANIESSLANVLARKGRYREAASYMAKSIKIQERLKGPAHASLSKPRSDYRAMLRKSHRHKYQAKVNKDVSG